MSSTLLERRFLQAFFATLAERGVTQIKYWGEGSDRVRLGFRKAFDVLAALAGNPESHEDVRSLYRIFRPDPISGTIEPFERGLLELNPGWTLERVTIHPRPDPFFGALHLVPVVRECVDTYMAHTDEGHLHAE